jgi:hypothetical protein
MVAGNSLLRSYTATLEQKAISFACLGTNEPASPGLPSKNCPGGVRTQVVFPSCWDGKLPPDSANHRSHMAYPEGVDTGACPPSHPNRLVTLFYEVIWQTDLFKDKWYGSSQPFVLSSG